MTKGARASKECRCSGFRIICIGFHLVMRKGGHEVLNCARVRPATPRIFPEGAGAGAVGADLAAKSGENYKTLHSTQKLLRCLSEAMRMLTGKSVSRLEHQKDSPSSIFYSSGKNGNSWNRCLVSKKKTNQYAADQKHIQKPVLNKFSASSVGCATTLHFTSLEIWQQYELKDL